ncbi:hypothetical protein RI129_006308 [Pyrocoelia pectoralis]|uniref:Cytochrome P450 n=1 Tax=Pyrocoelia pectoralis TaxID=417401 RepID=A0AAN7ZNJ5_9COLE
MVTFLTTCICLLVITIILCYFYLTRNFNYWKNQNVQCVKPIPLFGSLFSVIAQRKSINGYLNFLYKSTTLPYIGFFVIDQPSMLIRDPALIRRILVGDFDSFQNRNVLNNKYDKYGKNLLSLLKQPKWKEVRSNLTSAFSSRKLRHMVPLLVEVCDDMIHYIKTDCLNLESIDCKNISVNYEIDAISTCAFGIRTNSHENSEFATAAKNVLGTNLLRAFQMGAHFFAPLLVKIFRMKFCDPHSCLFLEKVLLKSMKERERLKIVRHDFLDLMKVIRAKNPQLFSRIVVYHEMVIGTFIQYLLGGLESSGSAMTYTIYELCMNPTIQTRLRNEILTVLAKHEIVTQETIQEMVYLDMVIKESLRKYPPLPFIDRACNTTYTIPNTDIVIKKGMPVFISLTALHHDENYFPNPMLFDPERFSSENKSSITPYTYMPFGDGYRNCLGIQFAILSVSLGLINLLSNFEVIPCKDTPSVISYERSSFLLTPLHNKIYVKFRSLND